MNEEEVAARAMHETREFAGEPVSVGLARGFASDVLAEWELDVDDAVLLVSELATNAVVHAATPFRVEMWRTAAGVRVEVRDHDPTPPTPRLSMLDAPTTGRGLILVTRLSRQWGYYLIDAGKAVWFEL